MLQPEKRVVRVKEIPMWQIFVFVLGIAFSAGSFAYQVTTLKEEQNDIERKYKEDILNLKAMNSQIEKEHRADMLSMGEVNRELVEAIGRLNVTISVLSTEVKHVKEQLDRL